LLVSILELATAGLKLSFVRILRVARSAKAMQAFRSIKYSVTMQKIILNMKNVVTSLFWALVLLFIVIFAIGIVMMEGVISHMEGAAGMVAAASAAPGYDTAFASVEGQDIVRDLYTLYGSISRTFTTLFRAISGADWSPFASALSSIGWGWGVLWSFYIFIVLFGTINIINGLIIDIFMKPLPADRAKELAADDELHRRICKLLISEMRALGRKGAEEPITRKTFQAMLKRDRLPCKLNELGINLERVAEPFHIVDTEGQGELAPSEVASHILDMRGAAKGTDFARIMRQVNRMRQDMSTLVASIIDTQRRNEPMLADSPDIKSVKMQTALI